MIDPKFATEQIERLSGLNFFPKPVKGDTASIAAFKELRLALECANSDSIGKRVVDDWIRTSPDAPKPAELRRAAYDENERAEANERAQYKPPAPKEAYCGRCQDTGIAESIDANSFNSVASLCDCPATDRVKMEDIASVNAARRKLLAAGVKTMLPNTRRISDFRSPAEVYAGEF